MVMGHHDTKNGIEGRSIGKVKNRRSGAADQTSEGSVSLTGTGRRGSGQGFGE